MSELLRDTIDWLCEPTRLLLGGAGLLAIVLWGRRFFTRVWVVVALLGGGAVFLAWAVGDPDFREIVTKPDNVPIVMLLAAVAFFGWLGLRQAVTNDERAARGEPNLQAEHGDQKVLCWPDLVYVELICAILVLVLLVVWSIEIEAPLEEPAASARTPNPAKAPWYFLGFQELLVYFDPWIAGVAVPTLLVLGLCAIPYLDRNPRGSGYYTFRERPFAVGFFFTGFVLFWISLMVIGTFLRGPNWAFFGPFETWDPSRIEPLGSVVLSGWFWNDLLGTTEPGAPLLRELPGLLVLLALFLVSPLVLARTLFRELRASMGGIRYHVFAQLLLWFGLVALKMILRWTVDLKYLVSIPEWSLNV